jgi:hypothetical protein
VRRTEMEKEMESSGLPPGWHHQPMPETLQPESRSAAYVSRRRSSQPHDATGHQTSSAFRSRARRLDLQTSEKSRGNLAATGYLRARCSRRPSSQCPLSDCHRVARSSSAMAKAMASWAMAMASAHDLAVDRRGMATGSGTAKRSGMAKAARRCTPRRCQHSDLAAVESTLRR